MTKFKHMPIISEKIIERPILKELAKYLKTDDILVVHGARQVGKTYILYSLKEYLTKQKQQVIYFDLEDSRFKSLLDNGAEEFIKYLAEQGFSDNSLSRGQKIFVLIDEIQYLDNPSSFLKLMVDHHKNFKLIVSGSSSFAIKSKFKDSLVGRTINFEIFPLSFEEFLNFKGYAYHAEILASRQLTAPKQSELFNLFREYILYGGYPKIVLASDLRLKEKYLQQIIDTYIRKDIKDLAKIKETDKFNKLVEVLAAQSGNLLAVTELSNTCKLSKQTVEHYLFILENTYVIKLVKPYYKNIRSELFKTAKIFFYDSGLMQMLWLKQLQKEIIGTALETAVFSELIKKYHQDNVFYWRTTDGKEIDFIVKKKNQIMPLEVKLNTNQFHKTALDYFTRKYKITAYQVTGLSGDFSSAHVIYPWSA